MPLCNLNTLNGFYLYMCMRVGIKIHSHIQLNLLPGNGSPRRRFPIDISYSNQTQSLDDATMPYPPPAV